MLPGKKYTPEDVVQILRRRAWWVLLPFAVVAAVTAVVARELPDRWQSQAVLLVVPQQVPTDYVKPMVTTRIDDQLQTMRDELLSRTRLEQIITDFNLYPDERAHGAIMQDVVEEMRRDITIDVRGGNGNTFTVAYTGSNPRTAQKVAAQLTSAFIDESAKDQSQMADEASQFLESATEDMRQRLEDQEHALQAYRQKYAGQLPSQLDANLTAQHNTQMQLQQVVESENRDRQQHIFVEREIADLQPLPVAADAPTPIPSPSPTDAPPANSSTAKLLDFYQARLKSEQANGWTDEHPEVKATRRMIADLQHKLDQEALEHPVGAAPTVSAADVERQRKLKDYHNQLDLLDKQIADEQTEEKRLQGISTDLQQRIQAVPARESEMTDLTRNDATLLSEYNSLLQKKEEASLASNLQRRQFGQNLKVIDSARLPERPVSPNRPLINVLGLAGGLAIGLGFVALLEYRDTTFKTDDEVAAQLSVRVLAVVPLMESVRDHRRAVRRQWLMSLAMSGVITACLAVVVYTFVYMR